MHLLVLFGLLIPATLCAQVAAPERALFFLVRFYRSYYYYDRHNWTFDWAQWLSLHYSQPHDYVRY